MQDSNNFCYDCKIWEIETEAKFTTFEDFFYPEQADPKGRQCTFHYWSFARKQGLETRSLEEFVADNPQAPLVDLPDEVIAAELI